MLNRNVPFHDVKSLSDVGPIGGGFADGRGFSWMIFRGFVGMAFSFAAP